MGRRNGIEINVAERSPSRWTQSELQIEIGVDGPGENVRSQFASGSRSMWPTRSPSGWTRGEPRIGVGQELAVQTASTRTLRPSARGPCGPPCSVAERSPSGWTRGEPRIGVGQELAVQTASTRTLRPSARGPCGPPCSVAHSVPEWMDPGRTSGWGRPGTRGPDSLDANPASISTGTVRATMQRGRTVPESIDLGRTSGRSLRRDRDRNPHPHPHLHPIPAPGTSNTPAHPRAPALRVPSPGHRASGSRRCSYSWRSRRGGRSR